MYVCMSVASFETFGSGSFGGPLGGPVGFGGPLGVRWVLVVLWGSGGFWWSFGGSLGVRWGRGEGGGGGEAP